MPTDKQNGRVSASEYVSRTPRSPLARGNRDLPLPKPVGSAILAAKPSESGECQIGSVASPQKIGGGDANRDLLG